MTPSDRPPRHRGKSTFRDSGQGAGVHALLRQRTHCGSDEKNRKLSAAAVDRKVSVNTHRFTDRFQSAGGFSTSHVSLTLMLIGTVAKNENRGNAVSRKGRVLRSLGTRPSFSGKTHQLRAGPGGLGPGPWTASSLQPRLTGWGPSGPA